jgi:Sulfotransferase domain
MTMVNAWNGTRHGGRHACLQCDLCFPPLLGFGTIADFEASGWRIGTFDEGPHICPTCSRRREHKPHLRRIPTELVTDAPSGQGGALPNLLVVGAAKCGTTSLHYYLSLHPEIHMSTPKELNFFQDPSCLDRLDLYASFFDKRSPVRGESTTIYSMHPVIPDVPQRISAALPDVKLIYLVRDPVERAFASYVEEFTHGMERRTFEDAFRDVDDPYNRYVAASRYASQIERFLACFSPENLLVADQADLRDRRSQTLREIFRFVGVDEGFTTQDFDRRLNPTDDKRGRNALGRWLRQTAPARAVVRLPPRFAGALLRPVRRVLSEQVEVPNPDPRLRERLVGVLEDEVSRLRRLTGNQFADWSAFNSGAVQR